MSQHTPGVGRRVRLHGLVATTCAIGTTFSLAAAAAQPAAARSAGGYKDVVLGTPTLVSYWRGGEAAVASHAIDSKGSNRGVYRKGTEHRAAGLLASSRHRAVAYDGNNDRMRVADDNSLDFVSSFTFEAWVKPSRLPRRATIMRKDFAYFIRAEKAALRVAFWDKKGRLRSLTARQRLAAGRTRHVVATYGSHTLRLYVNSKLVKSKKLPAGTRIRRTGNRLVIGDYRRQPFFGSIDEPAVYSRALKRKQIARHHAVGSRERRHVAPATGPNATAPGTSPSPPPPPPREAPSVGAPIWEARFEDGSFTAYRTALLEGTGFRATRAVTTERARTGLRSAKLVMPPSDGSSVGRHSSVFGGPIMGAGDEYWFGVSMYIGEDWDLSKLSGSSYFAHILGFRWQRDSDKYNGPGSGINAELVDGSPVFLSRVTTGDVGGDTGLLELGPVVKGQWIDWVIHVKWSTGSDGFRYYYRNGALVGEHHGRNMYQDLPISHRFGLYEGDQVDHTRTLFWDNHRMGTSYAVVDPSTR